MMPEAAVDILRAIRITESVGIDIRQTFNPIGHYEYPEVADVVNDLAPQVRAAFQAVTASAGALSQQK